MSKKSGHQEHPAKIRVRTEEGYKQTEIGVIPSDWETRKLGDVASIYSGGTPSTFNPNFWDGTVNWFTPTEVGKYKYLSESIRKLSHIGLENCSAQILPKGTILLTTRAGIGDLGILTKEASTNQGIQSLVVNSFNDNEYVYYLLLTVKNDLNKNASGSTFLEISPSNLKKIRVTVPKTLKEQKTIATVLTDTDKLINTLKTLIAKKKAIKQGAMQELLTGKTRLEGFSREWETRKLGDIASIYSGGTPSTFNSNFWNGTVNWFTPTEVGKHKYLSESIRKLSHIGLENCSAQILPKGTILLTTRAGIGDSGILTKEASTNQGIQSLVVNSFNDNEYVYYLLLTMKNDLNKNASGSTFLEISPNNLKKIRVTVPKDFEEQKAIAQILTDMDLEIATLETQLQKTQNLKQGMMQELLTGKTRLVSPEEGKPFNTLAKVAAPNETYSKTTH